MSAEVSPNIIPSIHSLFTQLENVKLSDKARIRKRLFNSKKIKVDDKKNKALLQIEQLIAKSVENKRQKIQTRPKVSYPESLPVSQNVDLIAKAISEN